ncbi:MAG: metallophosphoesterase family protein [Phycisphaerae bacterium]|nr:metallophosphoesterase family protein [Phycisphaerae bacterium]
MATRAIISDLHANIEATRAVLSHIGEQGIEEIYCLGDVVGYGTDPCACLDAAREFRFVCMGNHDHAAFIEPNGFNTPAERAVFWTRKNLESEPDIEARKARWEFFAGMEIHRIEDGVLYVHGSPRRPMHEYLFPDEPVTNISKLAGAFERIERACFVGHTHLPGIFTEDLRFLSPSQTDRRYKLSDHKVIINVGSVGQPRDLDPRACYVTFDGQEVTWHRVPYDFETTVEKILAVDELDDFLARRLVDGR